MPMLQHCCELTLVYTSRANHGSPQMETDGFYSPPFDSHPTEDCANAHLKPSVAFGPQSS